MQGTGSTAGIITSRRRVEAVVETLAAIHHHGEGIRELAHDARNMVTALSLYCDLLEEPGVLASSHHHYASELRLVAEASRRLVEKLSVLDCREEPGVISIGQGRLFEDLPEPVAADTGVTDMREELLALRNLLAAIAGPAITVTAAADGGSWPVSMTGENLVRALVNLVRNSTESIAGAGTIELFLNEQRDGAGVVLSVVLSVEDSGGGIPPALVDKVFEPGFTTHAGKSGRNRGLGLSITRSIVEAAGGRIAAGNRQPRGARFVMELPVRKELDGGSHPPRATSHQSITTTH
jgi:signal transduction histidine kinase